MTKILQKTIQLIEQNKLEAVLLAIIILVVAANYRSLDRWDYNAVDYRHFIEAYFGKRGLDWQSGDYRSAQVLFVITEGGLPNPIESRIMEIDEFNPQKLEKTWKLPNEVFIYKLVK